MNGEDKIETWDNCEIFWMIYSNHNNKTWLSNNLSGPGFLAGLAIYVCSYVCLDLNTFQVLL